MTRLQQKHRLLISETPNISSTDEPDTPGVYECPELTQAFYFSPGMQEVSSPTSLDSEDHDKTGEYHLSTLDYDVCT
jgi:hypothetical protein